MSASSPSSAPGAGAVRILIAEDDQGVRESLARVLRFEGYEVTTTNDGAQALESVLGGVPDLCILDVNMPFVDGLTVCRRLRTQHRSLPILVLTARHQVTDRVEGLDAGADDYLVKPFALDELLARIRALLRRTSAADNDAVLRVGDLVLDPARRQVFRSERELELTKTEFDLLDVLMTNTGLVLSRDTLYEKIWGFDFETNSKTLDVYIGYLRRKVEIDGEPKLIHTVRGIGYVVR